MRMFIAFAAFVAVASAGLLPHYDSHHSGYQYEEAASNDGYAYQSPEVDESQVDNYYLQPAASEQIEKIAQPEILLVKEKQHNNDGLGSYEYSYELSDGQKKEESAELKTIPATKEGEAATSAVVVRGSYTWVDATGKEHTITYVADENGFQPMGDDIPRR